MSWPPIDLSAFSWEALATLLTGFMAVGGAIFIGHRQVRILDRQTALAELNTRIALHDQRMAVYLAARRYLGQIVTEAAPADNDEQRAFERAMGDATFLYGPEVNAELRAIYVAANNYRATWTMIRVTERKGGQAAEHNDREHRQFEILSNLLTHLAEAFAPELTLHIANGS